MKKTSAWIKIVRPLNLLITFITVIVAVIICSYTKIDLGITLLAALSSIFSAASGNIINDYFDIAIDKINRPQRPLPSGDISQSKALVVYFLFVFLSVIAAIFVSLDALIIVVSANILLFMYSYILKKIPIIGNVTVALLTALTFIYGGIVAKNINAAVIPALFAFLINLVRELVKDIEDIDGDISSGIFTFPSRFGIPLTQKIISIITVALIFFTSYPYFTQIYKIEFFIIVLLTVDLILVHVLRTVFEKTTKSNLNKISRMLKAGMVFGLIAIYFGR
ncbi:MAG: geranylgeranylglycerol-phosphate geranylgeranyltransferase [Ignavibacteriales bacterium]|nr:MAG: geranylgeranylglycerol-phosphate geranylgeranyltransferase [Ignavibacteriales bacterium]